jgi:manganese/zinc/iron transport system substrate-binding protein
MVCERVVGKNMQRRDFLITALCSVGLPQVGFADTKPRILATTGMLGDLAQHLCQDFALVENLIEVGLDPHSFRPSQSDIRKLVNADLIIANGMGLEQQMEPLLEKLAKRAPLYFAGQILDSDALLPYSQDFPDRHDPHVWMDIDLWSRILVGISSALVEQFPIQTDVISRNLSDYKSKLRSLNAYAYEVLGTVPVDQRILITAHDAFQYFGHAYGFEVMGVQGISTDSEASILRLSEIVRTIVKRKIPAIFVETSVSDRNIRAILEGVRAEGGQVVLGGSLYSDSMGSPGTYEGTYVGMMDHNITTIARSLGGQAPRAGFEQKLTGITL